MMWTIPVIFDLWKIGVKIRSKCTFRSKNFVIEPFALSPQACLESNRTFSIPNLSHPGNSASKKPC